ncbi:hypothetical protein LENED_007710 [Lentinula edodes]|nr:hypothetical protein LENED_007710 [Lentinula edodes]
MTYISLAVFDILATLLVTNRMIQAIRGCGGFRKLARQNLSEYVLRSGVLYFGCALFRTEKIVLYYLRTKARLIVLTISGTIQPYPEQFSSRVVFHHDRAFSARFA